MPTPEELDAALQEKQRALKELEAKEQAEMVSKEVERKLLERAAESERKRQEGN